MCVCMTVSTEGVSASQEIAHGCFVFPRCVFLCVTFLVVIFRLFSLPAPPNTHTHRPRMENIKVTHRQRRDECDAAFTKQDVDVDIVESEYNVKKGDW